MIPSRRSFLRKGIYTSVAIFAGGQLLSQQNWMDSGDGIISKPNLLRFLVASDGHYGQVGTNYQQNLDELIAHIKREHAIEPLDCCIINGDLVHDEKKYMPIVKQHLDQLPVPYYVTQGNHDQVSPEEWKTIWGTPVNHTAVIRNQVLLMATTSNEKGEYICADLDWLKTELDKYKNQSAIYIFIHITPEKWTSYGIQCDQFLQLLTEYKNIVAVFNGHDHDQDHFKIKNNIPFLFDGHYGGNWGLDYRGYRVVAFKENRQLHTFMMNPHLKLNEAYF